MLLLLPSAWLALFFLFREAAVRRQPRSDWRFSFILASAGWAALLSVGTEILSLAAWLDEGRVRIFWLGLNAALWGGLVLMRRRLPQKSGGGFIGQGLKQLWAWPTDARVVLAAGGLFAIFLGGIALLTPTTNWDSLTYHMARVMHWIQQRSVAHYPTNMDGQLQMGPWSGYVQVHFCLLWGSDRFENMLQWSSMVGSMVVGTLLVRQLLRGGSSANPRAQAFAALLIVTLPTGIVESITTQTDYTTGFWLLCVCSLGLEWYREPADCAYAFGFGTALGLGVLTKFTMIFYGAPVGAAVAMALLWKERKSIRRVLLPGIGGLATALLLVAPHLIRNKMVFDSIIGSQASRTGTGVTHVSLSGVLSNIIRNAELHSNTGVPFLTHQLNRLAHTVQNWTGRSPDDPALSNLSSMYEPPDEFFVFDSFAASSWHAGLIVAALGVALAGFRKNQLALAGLVLAFAGFTLFCTGLRWQIWNSRYHLPLLLMCMPVVAAVIIPQILKWVSCFLGVGLLLFGVVIVANNRSRPIFDAAWRSQPRSEQLLSFQGIQYYQPMRAVVERIAAAGCAEVGLKLAADHPEYPFWVMLDEAGFKGEIHHQLVSGPSARLPAPAGIPDVIITTLNGNPNGEMAKTFPTQTEIGPYTLYWSAKMSQPERVRQAKQM
jgi:4-amino-4-deoxy-L-arabinose transferase-like glycosyltransferase